MTQTQFDLLDSACHKLEKLEGSAGDGTVTLTADERDELLALLECEFGFNKVEAE
jgi:hypothetical protein